MSAGKSRKQFKPNHSKPRRPRVMQFVLDEPPIPSPQQQQRQRQQQQINPSEYRHTTGDLRKALHGNVFQLRLLMLFLHRATKLYKKGFRLATEMTKAGKFDDVVLLYRKPDDTLVWRFLQAKHTVIQEKTITQANLFNNTEHAFSLVKYFHAYIKMKTDVLFEGASLESFVLCANHEFNPDAMTCLEQIHDTPDPILSFRTRRCPRYKLTDASKRKLNEQFDLLYNTTANPGDVEEFCAKLRIMLQFPNKDELYKLINQELGEEVTLLNPELASSNFEHHVHEWFSEYNNGQGRYMMIEDGERFLDSIKSNIKTLMTAGLSKVRPETLRQYNISFKTDVIDIDEFLDQDNYDILHVVTDSTIFSAIKTEQSLNRKEVFKNDDKCIFVCLDQILVEKIQTLTCDSFEQPNTHHICVIECQDNVFIDDASIQSLFSYLVDILSNNKYSRSADKTIPPKKLILISAGNHDLPTRIMQAQTGLHVKQVTDSISFEMMMGESQKTLLERVITYQDQPVKLCDLINVFAAIECLNLEILERLLRYDNIKVDAVKITEYDSYIPKLYVKRTLRRQVLHRTALQALHQSNIFFVYASGDLGVITNKLKLPVKHWGEQNCYSNGIILVPPSVTSKHVFERYKNVATNKFLLQYHNNVLLLCDARGDVAILESYLDDAPYVNDIKEDDFISNTMLHKKVNIVADDPGIGKSSLIGSLACKYQEQHLNFVVKINLNDHAFKPNTTLTKDVFYKSLQDVNFDQNDMESAVDFLVDMAHPGKQENTFQTELLRHALRSSNVEASYPHVMLLFDGFDEISPKYKPETLTLLKALIESRVKALWVTSRLHEKTSLERALSGAAFRLNNFNDTEKLSYMKLLIEDANIGLDFDAEFPNISGKFHSLLSGGHSDFTNIPLQVKMLTEVLVHLKNKLPVNFEMNHLYKMFIDIKFDIYYEEKKAAGVSVAGDESRERDSNNLQTLHQDIALVVFFPHLATEELQTKIEKDTAALMRVGLLVRGPETLRYIHQTYAEYFIAECISRRLEQSTIRQVFVKNILQENRFTAVRSFLDRSQDFPNKIQRYASEELQSFLKSTRQTETVLSRLIDEGNNVLFDQLLDFVNA